jgi:crotonobetainyl-CoA:carnitine CoA-transferase CaiB-like acyl-CoA transferase
MAPRRRTTCSSTARRGLVSLTGTPEELVKIGVSIANICAGSYAYSGILTALLVRAGRRPQTALRVSMPYWMSIVLPW